MNRLFLSIKKNGIFLLMFMATLGYAQEKKHIAESKDLVGFWSQLYPSWKDGKMSVYTVGSYKVINPDNTFYLFFAPKDKGVIGITLYGNYEIKSDSTYTEHIVQNLQSISNNTSSDMKYKFLSDDVLLVSFKNKEIANGKEIKELWARVKRVGEIPILPSKEELEKEIKGIVFPNNYK